MKFLKVIVSLLIIVLIGLYGAGWTLPSTTHVERSIVIKQPPLKVYSYLLDFRNFVTWSPWAMLDPDTRYEYSGADEGVGAKMNWYSEDESVGTGSQEIMSVREPELIQINLVFGGEQGGLVYYRLTPVDEGTELSWEFDTDFGSNIIGRYFGLMMDSMLGPFYERGLKDLKYQLEGPP